MTAEVTVVPDGDALAERGAALIADLVGTAVAVRGSASLALSGGSGPIPTLSRLAAKSLDWARVDVFQVDERCVPHDDARSNWAMLLKTLIEPAGIPPERRHPIPADRLPPEQAAEAYAAELVAVLGDPPRLDVCVLGVGPDGHTASLFPAAAQLEAHGWVVAAPPGLDPLVTRVTLTLATINQARVCIFLVPDAGKAEAVARALEPEGRTSDTPARGVQPGDGRLVWLLTEAAARGLAA